MNMTPIGGELFIDRFCAHRRAVVPAKPAPAKARPAVKPVASPPVEEEVASIPLAQVPDDAVSDTGRIRAEVAAFMNRDEPDGTDDGEVQEFLKERSGFDPSEVG